MTQIILFAFLLILLALLIAWATFHIREFFDYTTNGGQKPRWYHSARHREHLRRRHLGYDK